VRREVFEELVAEAVREVPTYFRKKLDNVEIVVEDWPGDEILETLNVPPHHTLFGLYQGVPRTKRTVYSPPIFPDRITLFQGPIEAACRGPREIREQIRETVIHEIAHHFGISDERLEELAATYWLENLRPDDFNKYEA
jgi:predicted Zn-dependent protease with MMP-like domain